MVSIFYFFCTEVAHIQNIAVTVRKAVLAFLTKHQESRKCADWNSSLLDFQKSRQFQMDNLFFS